jgi:hypothetical protein
LIRSCGGKIIPIRVRLRAPLSIQIEAEAHFVQLMFIAAVAAGRAVCRAMAPGSAPKPIAAGLMFFRSRIARAQFDGIYSPPAIKSKIGTSRRFAATSVIEVTAQGSSLPLPGDRCLTSAAFTACGDAARHGDGQEE